MKRIITKLIASIAVVIGVLFTSVVSANEPKTNDLTQELAGRAYEYTYSSGMSVTLNFTDNKAQWEIVAGAGKGAAASNDYVARVVEENVYFVQWYEPKGKVTVTILIHEPKKAVYGSVASPEWTEFDIAQIHTIVE